MNCQISGAGLLNIEEAKLIIVPTLICQLGLFLI